MECPGCFDPPFPNPKSAEITQQPRHGARVGGQPSAPPPLRAPWARQWISPQPIQAGPVPSAPGVISQLFCVGGWVVTKNKALLLWSLLISKCTGFGVYGRMPRSRFRLLQLTPRALLPDQGSLLRACSSRFKFSKGPLIVSAAARRHLLIFHAPVCSLMRPNFSTPDQSRANQNTAFRQAESAILICSSQIRSLPKLLSNQGTARA